MHRSTTPNSPAHLLFLPCELLSLITAHLDIPSCLNLARTCRLLLPYAQIGIWKSIRIVLPKHYGHTPYIAKHGYDEDEYEDWEDNIRVCAEGLRKQRVKDMVRNMFHAGTSLKWGFVQELIVEHLPGTGLDIIQILEFTYANLKSLVIQAVADIRLFAFPEGQSQIFWKNIVGENPYQRSFTSITNLDITLHRWDYQGTANPLLLACPNLRRLRLDLRAAKRYHMKFNDWPEDYGEYECVFRDLWEGDGFPNLLHLDILCVLCEDHGDMEADLKAILSRAPKLESLSVDSRNQEGVPLPVLGETQSFLAMPFPNLKKVAWLVDSMDQMLMMSRMGDIQLFDNATEAVYIGDIGSIAAERIEFIRLNPAPTLRTMIVQTEIHRSAYPSPAPLLSATGLPVTPVIETTKNLPIAPLVISDILKVHKSLQIIQFASSDSELKDITPTRDWVSHGVRGMIIDSLAHEGQELFLIRTLTYSVKHSVELRADIPVPDDPRSVSDNGQLAYLSTSDGAFGSYRSTFSIGSSLHWEISTDFLGKIIPLDVITRIAEAAGHENGEWEGRGIEVGDTAWKVLTEWLEKEGSPETALSCAVIPSKNAENL